MQSAKASCKSLCIQERASRDFGMSLGLLIFITSIEANLARLDHPQRDAQGYQQVHFQKL